MGGKRLRIVYADDDELMRTTVTDALVEEGIEVHSCDDGAGVAALCAEVRPHAVLLDINMPLVGGLEAARLLRSDIQNALLRLVAITGQGTWDLRREAMEAGFDEFLIKPAGVAALVKALQPV
jgi:CheY-like chemotaxis protein